MPFEVGSPYPVDDSKSVCLFPDIEIHVTRWIPFDCSQPTLFRNLGWFAHQSTCGSQRILRCEVCAVAKGGTGEARRCGGLKYLLLVFLAQFFQTKRNVCPQDWVLTQWNRRTSNWIPINWIYRFINISKHHQELPPKMGAWKSCCFQLQSS